MENEVVNTHCGYVAIVGRPNVGKSTLLNHLIGQKISITCRKPQTTRHRILGIKTQDDYQILYVDTPGLHQNTHKALNRYMNRVASHAIFDVDLILFMVDGLQWNADDEWVLQKITRSKIPVILVVNKIDKLADKTRLLPHLNMLSQKASFVEIIPLSAKKNDYVQMLEKIIVNYLPKKSFFFPPDQITDRSERFLVAEIIREKLMRQLGQELPYMLAVEIEQFKTEGKLIRISAVIYVEKVGQKSIVIGNKGARLKQVGHDARLDMEKLLDAKVFLELWVKVKSGWSDDERSLQSLGFQI